jgi:hypothetical protein
MVRFDGFSLGYEHFPGATHDAHTVQAIVTTILRAWFAQNGGRALAVNRQLQYAASAPRSARFYEQFVSALAKQLKKTARETGTTLSELVGGGFASMATKDRRQLIVCCC